MDDLSGRTFLVTGANTGIGRATVDDLAARGARVFLACRSEARTRPVIDEIASATGNDPLEFLPLDLADLASVRACAKSFLAPDEPLHVLSTTPGLAGQRGLTDERLRGDVRDQPRRAVPAHEPPARPAPRQRPCAGRQRGQRGAIQSASGIDFEAVRRPTRSLTGMPEYSVSKLANVLHAQELARRLEGSGVTTYSLHPGVIASDIWRRVPWPIRPLIKLRMRSPEEGAQTSLHCATSPDVAGETGLYYDDSRRREAGQGGDAAACR